MHTKDHVLDELKTMFRSVLGASASGGSHVQHSHLRGCVDGYMRALLSARIVTSAELLRLVAAERERAHGPAIGVLESPKGDEGVAAQILA